MSRSSLKRRKAKQRMREHDPKWAAIQTLLALHGFKARWRASIHSFGDTPVLSAGYGVYSGRPPRERLRGSIREDATLDEWIAKCTEFGQQHEDMYFLYHGNIGNRFMGKSATLAAAYGMGRTKWISLHDIVRSWNDDARKNPAEPKEAPRKPHSKGSRRGWRDHHPAPDTGVRERIPEARRHARSLYRK